MPVISSTDVTTFETHGSRFHSFVSPSRGSDQLCAWRLEVPPGLEGVAHQANRDEVLLVLDGDLRITLDGVQTALRKGDVALVPANSELQVDAGPTGASAWVTTTPGLEAVTRDGERITPPWSQ
jgi:quercetin dioxygenase-like cupin family protein